MRRQRETWCGDSGNLQQRHKPHLARKIVSQMWELSTRQESAEWVRHDKTREAHDEAGEHGARG